MDKYYVVIVVIVVLIGSACLYSFKVGYEDGYHDGEIAGYNNGAVSQAEKDNSVLLEYYDKITELNDEITELDSIIEQKEKTIYYLRQKKYDLPMFLQIADNVANTHNYSIPNYVCVDFTRELVSELRKQGYDAYSKKVVVDCDSGIFDEDSCRHYRGKHVITEITLYIESTGGYLVEPEYYDAYGI